MKRVLDNTSALLGEPLVPLPDVLQALHFCSEHVHRQRTQNPYLISQELAADDVTAPTPQEMVKLATYVHHAALVYETDIALVRAMLRQGGFEMVGFSQEVAGGLVSHYTAFHPVDKVVVLAIKGSSSIDDVVTDIIAGKELLFDAEEIGKVSAHAHSGFAAAARAIVAEVSGTVQALFVAQGYQLIVTGHSLGAGTACCVAKLLHEKGIPLQCYGYATPPSLDRRAALDVMPYVTSVVNHDDLFPRASIANAKCVGDIATVVATKQKLGGAVDPEELDALLCRGPQGRSAGERHSLFVAGRVLFLYIQQGQYEAAAKDGTMCSLRRIELTCTCMKDHLCEGYVEGTRQVAARLIAQPDKDFALWQFVQDDDEDL